jgi:ubiquinone/menaquinone biosynthesis C-methylase UbiE
MPMSSSGLPRVAEEFYRDKLFEHVGEQSEWLELGCGHQLLPWWLKSSAQDQQQLAARCKRLVGIDAVAEDIARHPYLHGRIVGDIERMPFADRSFDLITARSVMEHVAVPEITMREARRVLRPGGVFLMATPNLLYYQLLAAYVMPEGLRKRAVHFLEGRAEQDVFPAYYRMNTCRAVRQMADKVRMEVCSLETVECPPEFGRLGHPIADIERAITAMLRCRALERMRAVIVAVLRRPEEDSGCRPD